MKSFLNYCASKMILLNILQNAAIGLYNFFVSKFTVIPRNDTFLCYSTNQR